MSDWYEPISLIALVQSISCSCERKKTTFGFGKNLHYALEGNFWGQVDRHLEKDEMMIRTGCCCTLSHWQSEAGSRKRAKTLSLSGVVIANGRSIIKASIAENVRCLLVLPD